MEPPASPGVLLQPLSRQKCPSLSCVCSRCPNRCGVFCSCLQPPTVNSGNRSGYVSHLCRRGCRPVKAADFHRYVAWERETTECAVSVISPLMTSVLLTPAHKYPPDLPNMALTTDPALLLDFKHFFRFSLHTHTAP